MVQKMRAGLAALGIFIGTATVIWLVAMGEGVSYRIASRFLDRAATSSSARRNQTRATTTPAAASKRTGCCEPTTGAACRNIPNARHNPGT